MGTNKQLLTPMLNEGLGCGGEGARLNNTGVSGTNTPCQGQNTCLKSWCLRNYGPAMGLFKVCRLPEHLGTGH